MQLQIPKDNVQDCEQSIGRCFVAAIKTTKFGGDVAYAEVEAAEWGINIAKEAGLQQ